MGRKVTPAGPASAALSWSLSRTSERPLGSHGDRAVDGGHRRPEALPAQQFGLDPGVLGEPGDGAGPGGVEECLAAPLQRLPHPGPDHRRVGQQPLRERLLGRAPGLGTAQCLGPGLGVAQRRAARELQPVAAAGGDQGGVGVAVVVDQVDLVQLLGEGGPGPGRDEEVGT
ncbi:hypothetical protein GCM10020229_81130 [Kitasatospora albolonga]